MSEAIIYDTKRIQIATLCEYMGAKHDATFCGDGFVNILGCGKFDFISFNKAVTLYNNDVTVKHDFGADLVKLSYSKKTKSIKCLNHLLKFSEDLVEGEEGKRLAVKSLRNIASGKKA